MSTDSPVVEVPKGTVGFEHTVIRGEYGDGKSVASIFLPFDPTAEGALASTQATAKEAVFLALGVEYEFDEGGMPQPVMSAAAVAAAFGGTVEQTAPAAAPQAAPAQAATAAPTGMMNIKKLNQEFGMVDWLPAQCSKCQGTDVWDNRADHPDYGGTRSEKSPYFKCANKECGNGFWKPRD